MFRNAVRCISIPLLLAAMPAHADNFDYCYDAKRGLDEACYARKEYETRRYRAEADRLERREARHRAYDYTPPACNTWYWDPVTWQNRCAWVPVPIPPRPVYVLPGMR